MSPDSDVVRWTDLLFKWAVIIGPFVWFVAISYLGKYFVSKNEFDKIIPRIDGIERTILLMANQQRDIDDHEDRIRVLEQR
jgi:hypothetical protein